MTTAGQTFRRLVAGLVATCALVASAAADDERRVNYYDIAGTTADELRAALNRVGPTDASGARWDGYTAWHLGWHFFFGNDDGACVMERVETELRVEETLPRWEAPADADPRLVRKWHRYIAALEAHEAGHEKVARDAASAVRHAATRVDAAPDCATLDRRANVAARAALERAYRQEAGYDRRTRHGARQGAHFP